MPKTGPRTITGKYERAEDLPYLVTELNTILTDLAGRIDRSVGHAGPSVFVKQKTKDARGVASPGADLQNQRIVNVADPKDDLDVVNYRTMRRLQPGATEEEERRRFKPTEFCLPLGLTNQKRVTLPFVNGHSVEVDSNYSYAVGDDSTNGILAIYRTGIDNEFILLTDPLTLTNIVQRTLLIGHYLFGITVNSNDLTIVDLTDPYVPFEVSGSPFDMGATLRSIGWISQPGRYIGLGTATSGILVVDWSTPTAPTVVGTST